MGVHQLVWLWKLLHTPSAYTPVQLPLAARLG